MASAQTTPKTVFTGTAIAVIISVSFSAFSVSGVVSAFHAGAKPSSNVRQKTTARGPDEDEHEVADRDRAEAEPSHYHGRASSRKCRMTPIASSVANEIPSSTTATAAAAVVSPLSIRPKM